MLYSILQEFEEGEDACKVKEKKYMRSKHIAENPVNW
jgi:hypothetical protein